MLRSLPSTSLRYHYLRTSLQGAAPIPPVLYAYMVDQPCGSLEIPPGVNRIYDRGPQPTDAIDHPKAITGTVSRVMTAWLSPWDSL